MVVIPVPIGVKRVVVVEGAVWKFVSCAQCRQDFAYLLETKAVGEDHDLLFLDAEGSSKRAAANAQANLAKKCQNMVLPVPCPHCGFYQDEMLTILKEEQSSSGLFIIGLGVAALSLVPLLFSIPYIWIVTAVGVSAGVLLMAYDEIAAALFDPNAGDPERRKLIGQRNAIWGEQLAKLVAAEENAEPAKGRKSPSEGSGRG